MKFPSKIPERIRDEEHLEELLSEPSTGVLECLAQIPGDLILLGVGGKMGPSLARMARRAFDAIDKKRRVIGVARFSNPSLEKQLNQHGIETIRCDLLDPKQVNGLPDAPNVLVMTGMKFGSSGQESLTWAMNAYMPSLIANKFSQSRIVAFSTGNVYGLCPVGLGGSLETDPLRPVGEYALSCLGRERMYQYFSQSSNMPMAILRLNYASEMRYGVLVDTALKVKNGQTIDLSMGHFNAIWQADANAMALQAFGQISIPPFAVNLAGPEQLSVRRIATEFSRLFEVPVAFTGQEAADAFLSNGQLGHRLFGYPRITVQQMIFWIADWIKHGGAILGKPTHFENREGKY